MFLRNEGYTRSGIKSDSERMRVEEGLTLESVMVGEMSARR